MLPAGIWASPVPRIGPEGKKSAGLIKLQESGWTWAQANLAPASGPRSVSTRQHHGPEGKKSAGLIKLQESGWTWAQANLAPASGPRSMSAQGACRRPGPPRPAPPPRSATVQAGFRGQASTIVQVAAMSAQGACRRPGPPRPAPPPRSATVQAGFRGQARGRQGCRRRCTGYARLVRRPSSLE